jgi:hypothetical protein
LRLVGVTASGLEPEGSGQAELFADQDQARDRELDQVMDRVNEKFGRVLRRGGPPRRDGR